MEKVCAYCGEEATGYCEYGHEPICDDHTMRAEESEYREYLQEATIYCTEDPDHEKNAAGFDNL